MIINGINITSGAKETDLDTEGQVNKTAVKTTNSSSKQNGTNENDLVELSFEDDSITGAYEEAIASAQKQQEQQMQAYLQQLQNLMSQLSDLNKQQASLATNMTDGGEISTLQSSFSSLSSQKKQIYTNIINLLMTISQYEQQMAANTENLNNLLNQVKSAASNLEDANNFSFDSPASANGATQTNSTAPTNTNNTTPTNINNTTPATNSPNSKGANYMSKYNSQKGSSIASAAKSLYGGVTRAGGLCATGVSQAIKKSLGYQLHGNGCDYGNVLSGRSDWYEITDQVKNVQDLKNLPAGAVVSWSPYNTTSAGRIYGHVYICDGNGHGISDFTENISSYYMDRNSQFRVFIPV